MLAKELIKKYIKDDMQKEDIGVIVISRTKPITWYHVHFNEEIPHGWDIAIHVRD